MVPSNDGVNELRQRNHPSRIQIANLGQATTIQAPLSLGSGPWKGETLNPSSQPGVQLTGWPLSRNPLLNLHIKALGVAS